MAEQVAPASRLRAMTILDLAQVLAWRNHQDVRRYMLTQNEITKDEHQNWFERAAKDAHKHLLIFELNTQALGFVNFSELPCGRIADWGFYVAPGAAKGTGRQLGCAALDHAFSHLNFHKICGQALGYNERSIEFHTALGFQQEGTLRDQHFDGQHFHDVVCFGILCHEWQSKF